MSLKNLNYWTEQKQNMILMYYSSQYLSEEAIVISRPRP
jgi:hypothetical protein